MPRLKKVVEEVIITLSDDVNPSICASFKDLPQIFEEKDCKTRDKLLFDFLEKLIQLNTGPLKAFSSIFTGEQKTILKSLSILSS